MRRASTVSDATLSSEPAIALADAGLLSAFTSNEHGDLTDQPVATASGVRARTAPAVVGEAAVLDVVARAGVEELAVEAGLAEREASARARSVRSICPGRWGSASVTLLAQSTPGKRGTPGGGPWLDVVGDARRMDPWRGRPRLDQRVGVVEEVEVVAPPVPDHVEYW